MLEIDAASRTKVEDTREILDNIQYLPSKGRFKVYLIDEVHMLSRSSFNALLKTLEEPPEHVKFLLATTDPQKLPITILSRCLHLHLNVLDTSLISEQLKHILQLEQIESEPRAIQLLAKAANGSMRDALSLTDQAIALGNGKIDAASAASMLGTLDKAIPFSLINALYQSDGNTLMQQIEAAALQGADWDNLLAESIALLHQIALLQVVPTALGDYTDNEEELRFLAQYMAPNDVQLFYQILLMGRKELAFAPDKKMGVEMSFLRALAFMPKNVDAIKPPAATATIPTKKAESPIKTQPAQAVTLSSQNANDAMPIKQTVKSAIENQQLNDNTIVRSVTSDENTASQPEISLPDDASSITKNILEMRMQLIKEEQKPKKPELVDHHQPSNSSINSKRGDAQQLANKLGNNIERNDEETEQEEITAENYQWQACGLVETKNEPALDAKTLCDSLKVDKTPEMTKKLIVEMAEKDAWCAEIEQLELAPLIKQIAINSYFEQIDDNNIVLHMRSSVKHLIKSPANCTKLESALSAYSQKPLNLKIVIDDNQENKTPLEMREDLYQQKLEQAKQTINQDAKVEMICQYFDAKIDEASIRPV